MNIATRILIQRHRFEQNVLAARLGLVYIDQFKEGLAFLKDIRIALLTDLTFKFLPVIRGDVLSVLFNMLLRGDPTLQTLEVDQSD